MLTCFDSQLIISSPPLSWLTEAVHCLREVDPSVLRSHGRKDTTL
jgi:hypothetical protein